KGKKLTTTKGTTADVLLYTALQEAGVKYSDVNVINMDMAAAVSAFIAKASDAVATWSPFDVQIEKANPTARRLTEAKDYYPKSAIMGGWVASNKMYAKNRPILVSMAKAWLDANEALLKDTDNSLKIVHKAAYSSLPLSEVTEAFAKEKIFTNDEWAKQYKDGRAAKWIGQVEQVFIALGAFTGYVPPEKFFDPSIYLDAYETRK
ncbi:MAG: ABC transporter substrate-binding protein, partial [Bacillota bacterium]